MQVQVRSPFSVPFAAAPRGKAPIVPTEAVSAEAPLPRRLLGSLAMGVVMAAPMLAAPPALAAPTPSACQVLPAGMPASQPGVPVTGSQLAALQRVSTPTPCDNESAAQTRQQLGEALRDLTREAGTFNATVARVDNISRSLEPWLQRAPGTYADGDATVTVEVRQPFDKAEAPTTQVTWTQTIPSPDGDISGEKNTLMNLTVQGDYRSAGAFIDGEWAGSVTVEPDGREIAISRVGTQVFRGELALKDSLIAKQGRFSVEHRDDDTNDVTELGFDGHALTRASHPNFESVAEKMPQHTETSDQFLVGERGTLTRASDVTTYLLDKATFVDTTVSIGPDGGTHTQTATGTGADLWKTWLTRQESTQPGR